MDLNVSDEDLDSEHLIQIHGTIRLQALHRVNQKMDMKIADILIKKISLTYKRASVKFFRKLYKRGLRTCMRVNLYTSIYYTETNRIHN